MKRLLWGLGGLATLNAGFAAIAFAVMSGPPQLWSVLLFVNGIVAAVVGAGFCATKAFEQ